MDAFYNFECAIAHFCQSKKYWKMILDHAANQTEIFHQFHCPSWSSVVNKLCIFKRANFISGSHFPEYLFEKRTACASSDPQPFLFWRNLISLFEARGREEIWASISAVCRTTVWGKEKSVLGKNYWLPIFLSFLLRFFSPSSCLWNTCRRQGYNKGSPFF